MSDRTKIEWADATWNVVLGCDRVSAGCRACYAISNARIRESNPNPKIAGPYTGLVERRAGRIDWTGRVNLVPERLNLPLQWTKPRRIFVNAQSDLFHSEVPDQFVAQVFAVMAVAERHTFLVLTKRPGRMRSLLNQWSFREAIYRRILDLGNQRSCQAPWSTCEEMLWPLQNLWLGVSAEDQKWTSVRVPVLLQTPAAVRFVSAEPLLGAISLCRCGGTSNEIQRHPFLRSPACPLHGSVRLDWVIAGGESGREARPMHPNWARQLRDQCQAARVAFLFKQAGSVLAKEWGAHGKGVDPAEWPEQFPREFPA